VKGRIEMEREMRSFVNNEVNSENPDLLTPIDKTIYVLSDSTGETAKLLISRLLVQYRNLKPTIRLRANVRTREQLETVVCEVQASVSNALVFATLVDPELSGTFKEMAVKMDVRHINVMSPLLNSLSEFLEKEARGIPGGAAPPEAAAEIVDHEFFNRVEAVQFAQQHLSGLNRGDWKKADIILIGLSRVGKVSIAFYLAQTGVKAACVDCRPDSVLPKELFALDPGKVVVVEIQPNILARRRKNRVEELRSKAMPMLFEPDYTDLGRIQRESEHLNEVIKQNPGWLGPVDCTHLAIEECASVIMRTLGEAQG